MPDLYIITGSNGAGKSTIGPSYLPPNICDSSEIFNGDKLFQDRKNELWRQGIKAIKEARNLAFDFVSKLFDISVEHALLNFTDFVYEGHFTNDATWDIPKKFKAAGYSIHIIFFGLTDTELSQLRVINRTKEGGHYVTPLEVEANFYGNMQKLDKYFILFDTLQIIDTSESEHIVIATFVKGKLNSSIAYPKIPEWFLKNLPNITEEIRKL